MKTKNKTKCNGNFTIGDRERNCEFSKYNYLFTQICAY